MPGRSRTVSFLLSLARCALLVIALLCAYFGAASAAFYSRQRTLNRVQNALPLPPEPAPASSTRLLVFAPHCDDETLGCAGLMQQTLAAGGSVRAVILTNGDAFPAAAEREFRRLHLQPADYIRFAGLRQQETLAALRALGVKSADVSFYGYPDRGLMPLWNDYWTPERLYASPTTRCNAAPYPLAAHPNAPYCGASVLTDIKAALKAFHPTLITVTHPAEDHADHAAAAAFVALALRELQADPQEADWAKRAHLQYYLIHRGDWPVPPDKSGAALAPPAAMMGQETRWQARPLTSDETTRKLRSIALYPSQTAIMEPFLNAFARANEIYGEQPPAQIAAVPDGTMHTDANLADWKTLPPVLLSPLADNMLRDRIGGGDLRAISACRDSEHLYLRIETRLNINPRVSFVVRLRAIHSTGESAGRALTLRLSPRNGTDSDGVQTAVRGRVLEAALPWNALMSDKSSFQILALSAETSLAGVSIDQTGIRLLNL